jgi:hypothetical protein
MPLLILAKLNASELQLIAAKVSAILGWDEARAKQEIAALALTSD